MSDMDEFEPVIVAFCCRYCAYNAADLAGSLRLSYPPNVRIVQSQCSGSVDPGMILKAFECGADGVMVAGCMPGDCHFMEGNYRAQPRVTHAKTLLDEVGLGADRVEMFYMSAAMGRKFADTVTAFTERIRALGPSPACRPGEASKAAGPPKQ